MGRKLYLGSQAVTPVVTVEKTKYAIDMDVMFGNIDTNGTMQPSAINGNVVFSGVRDMATEAAQGAFYSKRNITSVSFPDLVTITGEYAAAYMFYGCNNLANFSMDSLTSLNGFYVANYMFYGCKGLPIIDISSLISIAGEGAADYMFNNCSGATSVDASLLTSINGGYAAERMFYRCTNVETIDVSSLTSIYGSNAITMAFYGFSKLTSIRFPSFRRADGNAWAQNTFGTNMALTEIHFCMDMEAYVGNLNGYSTKWGATNATIYFDLVNRITVNGVEYYRSEQDSIRSNHVKQYVGWTNKTITVNGTVYRRAKALDTIVAPTYGSTTRYPQVYGWVTTNDVAVYTTDRLPTTESAVYTDEEATTSAGTISAVSTNDIVYTAFNSTTEAEPDVGTTVYSDTGQTVLGTITAVA